MPVLKSIVRSSCRMCHGVCQVLVHLEGDRVVKITGDPDSPTSRGYLCPKGAASPELLYHPDRLTHPLRRVGNRGENNWKRISWDEALDEIAARFGAIKEESGAEYVAVCQGTGRPYIDFTQRFAYAFGSPNFVAPAHICYLPRVFASALTLGQLPVADVYDFGGVSPSTMVIWGCNVTHFGASDGMCGSTIKRALERACKVIVVDPRRIEPAEKADHWLQLRPGTDGALALGMIHTIIGEDLLDREFIDKYTIGFEKLVAHIQPYSAEWASNITRLNADDIRAAARTYASNGPAALLWGNGAGDMSLSSLQNARALLILRAITGNIDRPGSDVLWVPPKNIRSKSLFMNPEQRGIQFLPKDKKSVSAEKFTLDLFAHPPTFWDSIVTGKPYRPRAVWIVGSNPLVSTSSSLTIEKALRDHIEFTVVSDLFMTPTAQLADLVLPAATWLEQDDVVNVHKVWCMLARKKVAQIGEVRDDREVILELAKRLGLDEAFPWSDYRCYLEWLLEESEMDFDAFCEVGFVQGEMRYHKYRENGFATPSGKFEIYSSTMEEMGLSPLPVYREPGHSPLATPELKKKYPLILTTGARSREFFHSEGRQIESLRRLNPDPLVEIHPDTAASLGIGDGDWVWIETGNGRIQMRAKLFDGIALDVVSAQHAWWFPEEAAPDYGWKKSSVNLLFGSDSGYDPETGSECIRSTLCKVYRKSDE